jgi:hypothetical protein
VNILTSDIDNIYVTLDFEAFDDLLKTFEFFRGIRLNRLVHTVSVLGATFPNSLSDLSLLLYHIHWRPWHANTMTPFKSCQERLLSDFSELWGNHLQISSHDFFSFWTFWPLTFDNIYVTLNFEAYDDIWVTSEFFRGRLLNRLVHTVSVFGATFPNSLSDLSLLLYQVQLTASTFQDNNAI